MEIVPTRGALGAEIRGVDIATPLAPQCVAALKNAGFEYLLIFFREQHLIDEGHVRFSRSFGEPEPPVRARLEGDSPLREIAWMTSRCESNGS
jgi:taurine dioxygenase